MTGKWFDPHKSFLSLPVLWWTVGVIFLVAVICSATIVSCSDLSADFSYRGFNGFVDVFRVPLAILALIIPVVAMLSSNHRSEQTKEQMRLAQAQNNFANHYKHVEEFVKYCELCKTERLKTQDPRQLYQLIFPKSHGGDFHVDAKFIASIDGVVYKFLKEPDFSFCSDVDWRKVLFNWNMAKKSLLKDLFISDRGGGEGGSVLWDGFSIHVLNQDIRFFIDDIFSVLRFVDQILKFDFEYISTPVLGRIAVLWRDEIPSVNIASIGNFRSFDLAKIVGVDH